MEAWLQLPNFHRNEIENGSMELALQLLEEFEWQPAIDLEKLSSKRGIDCCPSEICFSNELGKVLRIVPKTISRVTIVYEFNDILDSPPFERAQCLSIQFVKFSDVRKFATLHYNGEHQAIIDLLSPKL
ncbi:MAG: hypothetical protein ACKVJU_22545 [Verrucomicrobiales bacterium]